MLSPTIIEKTTLRLLKTNSVTVVIVEDTAIGTRLDSFNIYPPLIKYIYSNVNSIFCEHAAACFIRLNLIFFQCTGCYILDGREQCSKLTEKPPDITAGAV